MRDYTVKIIVATHKKYQMPKDDMYLPLHVGAEGKLDEDGNDLDLGYTKDNSGDNISNLNSSFCELTGLYWAWKNIDADYIGLVHYRRHFSLKKKAGFENVLTYAELRPYLGKIRVFVPTKRWYVIETLKSHYDHTHYPEHLKITRDVLAEKSINDINVYDKVVNRRWGYMFNMMIMEKNLLDEYCNWLFDILIEVFKRVDISNYQSFERRYIGRISEILFNVWIEKMLRSYQIKKCQIMELGCDVEENLIKKIPSFLKAKFLGKKYEGSF